MIHIVRHFMILTGILLSPLYGLWLFGGKLCDWRDRKRRA
jgi:hypothetical protein